MEVLYIIGGLLVSTYAEHNFILHAISKLYLAKTKVKGLFVPIQRSTLIKSKDKNSNQVKIQVNKNVSKYAESLP